MDICLTNTEMRVLGCLMEKELATPEYYPLSLNALINACNQKTNRTPVLQLDEAEVQAALRSLKEQRLVYQSDASRVPKYWQSVSKDLDLDHGEAALIAVLLLRGPQTVGELRLRTDAMHAYADLEAVAAALDHLAEAGLVVLLPRQPGQKEQRYGHLLAAEGGAVGTPVEPQVSLPGGLRTSATEERLAALEQELTVLREELATLRAAFTEFKAQLGE